MRRTLAALAVVAAPPALAQEPMSAAEFDAYATGKTLYYATGGQPYGAEQYLPQRRVIWTFLDGDCVEGSWYEADGLICFSYDRDPGNPQCWSFFRAPTGLTARFENDPAATQLIEVEQSREPLICTGPEVGV
ncbi:hypothetical protein [Rhodovulum adriaticum]|uniref:Uncharacterized protein n=1 Tax=Rhodovulum adriaticum TaxID=35804 RepID=A0A4V2SMA1_RHOAD|nr:hypothetical protein [Rhodovulum adriaticum]MBK1637194.1 hypothetical protein [Rhodovulum adriaticum]TCP26436.1 hypothetical protein EV656_102403 [Rhodovulum adriaticum]